MKKFLKYFFGIFLGLLLVLYLLFRFGMGEMSASEKELAALFEGLPQQPVHQTYQVDGHTMHYVEIGADTLPTILFIHGSPGSWDAYSAYLADSLLLTKFRMISVDRIGYGKSDLGMAEPSVLKQAQYIAPIFDRLNDSLSLTLVGHSFGGPIAARLAMEYPDKIDRLILLAALADPELESRPAFLGPLRKKSLRWLVPQDLDISNREIFTCKQELEEMDPMWGKITASTIVIQGDKDVLVEKENADYIRKKLINAPVEVMILVGVNHFIVWSHFEMIRDILMEIEN